MAGSYNVAKNNANYNLCLKGLQDFYLLCQDQTNVEKMWADAESTCVYQCFALYHQFCATYKRP